MSQQESNSKSDMIASVILRVGLICLVMMVTVGVSVFLGFASDSPSAPKQPIDQAFLSLKLFVASGLLLAITPMRLYQSKSLFIKVALAVLLLLLVQPVVVIPQVLNQSSAPAA